MSILIGGPDAKLYRLAQPLERAQIKVDRCETSEAARDYLRDLTRAYELVFLCSTWQIPENDYLKALAKAHGACLAYTRLADIEAHPDTVIEGIDDDGGNTIDLAPHDVERWRNVLTFAKREPDEYPALRDALGARTNLFQYHAPVKRSA